LRNVVVFGAGMTAELAAFYLTHDAGRAVSAFTVDAAHSPGPVLHGRPVVPWEEIEGCFPPDTTEIFVAIGYARLNKLRRDKVAEVRAKGYQVSHYVSTRATTFVDFTPAANQFILENNTIQPFVRIGENVTLWSGNHIGHHSTIGEDTFIASHVVVSGGVTVGPRCFIGVNATIRDGVTIGADCVIGAGSLILSDIPDNAVLSPSATEISKVPSFRLRRI
jgi:sugar O-acyltransferase (sialic acid O-acetyltransferase NeuD family)